MLVSDLRQDYRKTRLQPLAQADFEDLSAIYREFEKIAAATLTAEDLGPAADIQLQRYLDLRYHGQFWKLRIDVANGSLGVADRETLKEAFDRLHEQSYGYSVPAEPVEIVNVGLSARGTVPKAKLREIASGSKSPAAAMKGTRGVYLSEAGSFIDCPIYDRYALLQGNVLSGPAVI